MNRLLSHTWQEYASLHQTTIAPQGPADVVSTDDEFSEEYDDSNTAVIVDMTDEFERLGIPLND